MKSMVRRVLLISLLLVTMLSMFDGSQAQSRLLYAYIVSTEARIQLQTIGSGEVSSSQGSEPLPIQLVFRAEPSPDGEWIALLSGTDQPDVQNVSVWNVETHDLREVARGYVHYNQEHDDYSLRWSPNSRYLDIVASQGDRGELLVYDSVNDTTLNFTQDEIHQQYLAWSPNSSQIAVSAWQLIEMGPEAMAKLQIFDVSTGDPILSFDLTAVSFPLQTPVCDLGWSPDNRFVSFQSGCQIPSSASPREVFIWDVQDNTVRTITNLTTDAFLANPGIIIQGSYDTAWQTSENLIIGATIFVQGEEPVSQTISYNPATEATQIIAPVTFVNLNVNPVSNALTFQLLPDLPQVPSLENQLPIQILPPEDLEQDEGDVPTLTTRAHIIETLGGCDLTWSPDGRTLAYTIRADGNCRAVVESIILVDSETAAMQQFNISQDEIGHVIPVGWIAG